LDWAAVAPGVGTPLVVWGGVLEVALGAGAPGAGCRETAGVLAAAAAAAPTAAAGATLSAPGSAAVAAYRAAAPFLGRSFHARLALTGAATEALKLLALVRASLTA
jgi:hypothetical protein